ncbi:hypothetical protein [Okeania sp.]|uniref:hypothetical protein n=1 Tax=Okeania sp. TaxID=3100323 RepID=UPI002B4ABCB1|nr:hypothetical protein [Okeania sp.]MEB3342790.1 hypothetical protein [Okeania sp.]
MKKTTKITIYFSLFILGSTLSSCQVLGGYLLEKVADCALFNQCPQPRQETERQPPPETVPRQETQRQQVPEKNQKIVPEKFDPFTIETQINQGYVFLSSKSGEQYTGRIINSEIRDRQNWEESGVAAWIDWDDGQTSSILFMSNFRVGVWQTGVEYRGKWYWGNNDNLLYVKMDGGALYKFSKRRLDSQTNRQKNLRSSSEKALRNYYQNLNNYKYESAWNYLSSRMQSEGYQSYIDWWTQVQKIEVISTKLISENRFNSTVDSRLRYITKSGREINQKLRFDLVWETSSDHWLINKVERLALLN